LLEFLRTIFKAALLQTVCYLRKCSVLLVLLARLGDKKGICDRAEETLSDTVFPHILLTTRASQKAEYKYSVYSIHY